MRSNRKKPESDLRKYHTVFLQTGLIVVLLIFIIAMKVDLNSGDNDVDLTEEQEVVQMEKIERTKQEEKPPPPPRPPVPVEVPNDEVLEDQIINIDAEINLDQPLEAPPPPSDDDSDEDFFVAVQQMPELIGGMRSLQNCVKYPEMARKAGIEGQVIVQFIVNEQGEVENPKVIRGIGGGADKEAIRCVEKQEFKPGRQRGKPVRVQYSLPVIFKLQN